MKYFCSHDWPKWSPIVNAYSGAYQFRSCNKCNKVVSREVSCTNDVNLAVWNTDKQDSCSDGKVIELTRDELIKEAGDL